MSIENEEAELLKTSAALIMEQKQKIEELEKRAEKRDLINSIMKKMEKEAMLTDFNRNEKREILEEKDIDKLANIKEVLDNFVRNSKFRIGEVGDRSKTANSNNDVERFKAILMGDNTV